MQLRTDRTSASCKPGGDWDLIKVDYEGNVLVSGPDTNDTSIKLITAGSSTEPPALGSEVYINDNIPQGTTTPTSVWNDTVKDESGGNITQMGSRVVNTEDIIEALPASETQAYVLVNSGCRPAFRSEDVTDTRIIQTFLDDAGLIQDAITDISFPYSFPYSPSNSNDEFGDAWEYTDQPREGSAWVRNVGGFPDIAENTTPLFDVPANPHDVAAGETIYTNLEIALHAAADVAEGK